jgi:precorrin-6Y C5,15-methyltransferase (decarboxylating)
MSKWLAIVGIGEDGLAGLSGPARALVDNAEILVGGARHLAMVPKEGPDDGRERLVWSRPLDRFVDRVERHRGRAVCVLATGDPMCFGIGVTLARRIPMSEMTIVPGVSAYSLACARLGWPLGETDTLTLHGRPLETVSSYLQPGARLLILSHDGATPGAVAGLLDRHGFGPSRLTVFEHMGGAAERMIESSAAEWQVNDVADLNTVAVECVPTPDAAIRPRVPGLPDHAFAHDGLITKREVRAATIALLSPLPGQLLWDVGAGCGSIAIEWSRSARGARAVAVERDAERCRLIADNAAALGTPDIEIVPTAAPQALDGLAPPDAVFIGGGAADDGIFEACWAALSPGGRLAANVVTVEGEQALFAWRERAGGELTRIAVSHAEPLGGLTGWRPQMAVTQFMAVKP